ncbi:MAG TPA: serine hydrolase domain-containing protein [Thermoanaerobaculia bacterium]|nr:serine hydrolase domain-containing protein [Thermoanaerobaculia bacterium]
MRLRFLILSCVFAAALSAQQRIRIGGGADPALTKDWPRSEAGLPAFQKFLDELAARDLFSGTVLIARGNETVLQKSIGLADKEHNVPNTSETKYNIGSINKLFTRTALRQLAVDFSKPLRAYLPDYPSPIADKITIQQIAEMSSGMGDVFGPKYDATAKNRIRALNDYVPFFVDQPLEFEPGTKRRYSNAGYIVLGLVIERLSGMSYYDYVRTKLFAPAGMNDTDSYPLDSIVPNRAIGYVGPKHARTNIYELPARGSSAGGGYSTVGDLLRFVRAHPEIQGGFGGGAEGINAAVEHEGEYTIVVLSNYDPPAAEHVAQNARRALGLAVDE